MWDLLPTWKWLLRWDKWAKHLVRSLLRLYEYLQVDEVGLEFHWARKSHFELAEELGGVLLQPLAPKLSVKIFPKHICDQQLIWNP